MILRTHGCLRLLGLLLLLEVQLGCGRAEEPTNSRLPRVKAFEVGEEALGQIRSISGQVAAAHRSPLSFGVSGTVDRVNSSAGDRVAEGQVLATLDDEPLKIAVALARSKLAGSRAVLVEAEQAYGRAERLLEEGAGSRANFEVATSNVRSTRASLRGAQSELEQAERDLRRGDLRAPFDGQLAERSIEPFQEVGASASAFVLQADRALKIELQVPEALIREVDYNQAVRVRFPTLTNVELVGLVSLIGAQAGTGNSFPVEIQLPNSEADLRPGMSASVTFNFDAYLAGRRAYLIPLSAIAIDVGLLAGGNAEDAEVPVFVFDEETGRLRVQKVRLGGLRGNQLEVFEGLKPGDKVISAGVAFLRDGMEVELWSPELGLGDG